MTRITSFALVLCLGLASLVAQEKQPGGLWGIHVGPAAPIPADERLDWAEQDRLAEAAPQWVLWRAAHPDWRMLFDARTGLPWRAYGPGITVTMPNPDRAAVVAAAHALVDDLAPMLPGSAADEVFVNATHAGSLWYVTFNQLHGGARVIDCGLTLRIDDFGKLVLWGGHFVAVAQVPTRANVDSAVASAYAVNYIATNGWSDNATVMRELAHELVVHVGDSATALVPHLAWRLAFSADHPRAEWRVFVDASTGDVLQAWNDIREDDDSAVETPASARASEVPIDGRVVATWLNHLPRHLAAAVWFTSVSGVATGTVHDLIPPTGTPVLRNFTDLRVIVNGATVYTDATGMYSYTGGGATVAVSAGMTGRWISVVNTGMTAAAFSNPTASGTADIAWTDSNSTVAERDAFFFAHKAHANLLLRNPAETLFTAAIPANLNVTGTCNAYYDGSSINFFPPGGGCINTATSGSVVIHEYGHHVTTTIYASHGRTIPGHLGEGFSDCQAGATEDTNVIGDGFQGVGTMVRNLNNTCQYPTSCGTEIHARGQLIGACYWHTRQLFATAYGTAGKVQMDQYLYRHFHGSPQTETESCLDLLLQDDNNSNLADGTPNLQKFYQAFTTQHGVPFPVPLMGITHAPLVDTLDQLQNYRVVATINSLTGSAVSSAFVYRSINGGSFIASAMTSLGNGLWQGFIPVQPANTVVAYYVEAHDAASGVGRLPASAPTASLVFHTYRPITIFSDSFEQPSGWTHAAVAGADDWQNQAPGNPAHAYDPPTSFDGTKCWGNDLSAPGYNGNYPDNNNNHLDSPTINCTGRTGVSLTYRRWLTVEDGLYDHANILVSNNAGTTWTQVWTNPATVGGTTPFIDTSWVEHTINLSALADNQANVRIRFELISDGGVNFGGWTIDALKLTAHPAAPIVTLTGSSTGGQLQTVRVAGNPGDAVILAADFTTNPTFYQGFGTLSLDVASPTLVLIFDATQVITPAGALTFSFMVPPWSGISVKFEGAILPVNYGQPVITNVATMTIS